MSAQILLYLAPALLLLAALACDCYPGERLLDALVHRGASVLGRGAEPAAPRLLAVRSFPRGGVLLAMALAGRGPPSRARRVRGTQVRKQCNERKR